MATGGDTRTGLDVPAASEPAAGSVAASARATATAELVLEIATAAAGERDLEAILRVALDRLRHVVAFTGGSIAVVDGDDLVIRAAVGPFEAEALGQRLARGHGRSWQVVSTLEPACIDDMQAAGIRAAGARAGAEMRSWIAVPIARRGEGIGLLEVDSTVPFAFARADVELVATVGRALAGPIDLAARYAAEQRAGLLRDAFIGVVSHELRTPITTIYGMSALLRQRGESMTAEARAQIVADIEAEADRLRRLAEDLLVLSRAEVGRLVLSRDPVLLWHLVQRAVDAERARHPGRLYEMDRPAASALVEGDETYLEQVVQNLLSNAAKYSPTDAPIRIELEADAGEARVRVLDRGGGLPDGEPDRLFELFYRAPEAARQAAGAGIGLFVCRELISAFGGRIWAARRDEGGSEFGFSLPIHHEDRDLP